MAKKSTLTPAELKARKAEQDHARYLRNKAAKAAGTTAAKLAAKPDTSAVKPLRPEPKAAKPTLVADPHAHRAQAQAADPAPKAKKARKEKAPRVLSAEAPRVLRIRDLGGDRLEWLAKRRHETGRSIRDLLADAIDLFRSQGAVTGWRASA